MNLKFLVYSLITILFFTSCNENFEDLTESKKYDVLNAVAKQIFLKDFSNQFNKLANEIDSATFEQKVGSLVDLVILCYDENDSLNVVYPIKYNGKVNSFFVMSKNDGPFILENKEGINFEFAHQNGLNKVLLHLFDIKHLLDKNFINYKSIAKCLEQYFSFKKANNIIILKAKNNKHNFINNIYEPKTLCDKIEMTVARYYGASLNMSKKNILENDHYLLEALLASGFGCSCKL